MNQKLSSLISQNSKRLIDAGIDQGVAEVEIILCYILGVDRLKLYLNGNDLLKEQHLSQLEEIIQRRTTRYPLQYILGEAWFYGRRFTVSPEVMVPTPETEMLCEAAMGFIRSQKYERPQILDVGVGSGVISVTLANELPDCSITAVDISDEAIEVAKQNANELGGNDKIEFRHSDFFSAIDAEERFDIILSNPPYISEDEYRELPPEVLADPKISLTADDDGMGAIANIIDVAPSYLCHNGRILFEIGYNQADRVSRLTENDDRYQSITILKDLNDIDRVVILACDN
ncbi:MAG: peptide chain release factor N(5)-glutamine methyltransferase [candidate division Zixibacteria bacterium]|nr:peptide chain release factor N(5)-glutamine methyltransferase [candidate division Zixibacteria bacterium]